MRPGTHALRVVLAAFKDRGELTPAEIMQILTDAGCSRRSWEHEVRPELRRSGVLRQSRQHGKVAWLRADTSLPPRARRLRDRYSCEQRAARGETPSPPPQPQKKFRYGSPKYIKARLTYEHHAEAQIAATHPPRASGDGETFIDDHYFGVCRGCGRPPQKHRTVYAPGAKPSVSASADIVRRANEVFGSGTPPTSMINASNRDY